MKTIEERAKEAGIVSQYKSDYRYDARSVESGYMQGATEQKVIDDAKWLKIKSSWEKEAQITHDDIANYKQGYHDAVEQACEWLESYIACGVSPEGTYAFVAKFRKAMEE